MTTKIYKVAAIPGDGIGQEVITAGLEVLDALEVREGTFKFEISHFDWGTDRYLKTGEMMPSDGREQIRNMDAIYFGSAGDPRVADHISLWGLRLAICQPFDQYANVRPSKFFQALKHRLKTSQRRI